MASDTKREGTAKTQRPGALLGRPRARTAKAPTAVVAEPNETDSNSNTPEVPVMGGESEGVSTAATGETVAETAAAPVENAPAAARKKTRESPDAGEPAQKVRPSRPADEHNVDDGEAITHRHEASHEEPGDFTVACRFCRRTQEVCRSRLRNAFEWSISFLVVPYRCLYCGYRGFALRFQVPKSPANQQILREINPKR